MKNVHPQNANPQNVHPQNARRRVVITGIGAVTPIGNTMSDTWNGVIEGRKSVEITKVFDATTFLVTFPIKFKSLNWTKEVLLSRTSAIF